VLQRPNFEAEARKLNAGMLAWLVGAPARILAIYWQLRWLRVQPTWKRSSHIS